MLSQRALALICCPLVFLAAVPAAHAQGATSRQADGDGARCAQVLDLLAQDRIEDAAKVANGGPGNLTQIIEGFRRIMNVVHTRTQNAPMASRRKLDDVTLPDGKVAAVQSWEFPGVTGIAGCARFEVGSEWRLELELRESRDLMMQNLQERVRNTERSMGVVNTGSPDNGGTKPPADGDAAVLGGNKPPAVGDAAPSAGSKPPPSGGGFVK